MLYVLKNKKVITWLVIIALTLTFIFFQSSMSLEASSDESTIVSAFFEKLFYVKPKPEEPKEEVPDDPGVNDPSGETPSNPEVDDPSGETPSNPEVDDPSGETPSNPEVDDPSGETPGNPEVDDPSGETPSNPEVDDPSGETPSNPEVDDPSGETPSNPEVDDPSGGTPDDPEVDDPNGETPDDPEVDDPSGETPDNPEVDDPNGETPDDPEVDDPNGETPDEPEEPAKVEKVPGKISLYIRANMRKIAHFIEHGILGLEIFFLAFVLEKILGKRGIILPVKISTLVICINIGVLVAFADESIQILSGRGPSVKDMWIDIAGFASFTAVCFIITLIVNSIRFVISKIKA